MDKFILDLLEKNMIDLCNKIIHKAERIIETEKEIKIYYSEIYKLMFEMRGIKDSLEQQEIDLTGRVFHLVDLDELINLKRKGW